MLPEILGLNSYTVATVLGYGFAIVLGAYLGLNDGRSWRDMTELSVVVVISGVLGAKVFHTLFEAAGHRLPDGTIAESLWDLLSADPWHWARLFEAGYVFYGGAVFGVGFAYLWTIRAGVPAKGSFGDYAAPGFAFGVFIGRVGCFLAGCCHGTPTDLPWAVQFNESHVSHGVPIHPVQLYDAGYGFLMFVVCLVLYRRRRFPGEVFVVFVLSYAAWRFTTEMFRGDADRGVWFGGTLSTSQLVSLAVIPVTLFFYFRELKRFKAGETDAVKT